MQTRRSDDSTLAQPFVIRLEGRAASTSATPPRSHAVRLDERDRDTRGDREERNREPYQYAPPA